ncbi:MAG: PucR family transcriptional regulator ligand-binding domain-containing protein [Lachnospiraceae bacterium]|nr:PucR family transcriptional regulator ligand-binding domain-containing protein [Lachnospiraceae bacterium]
MAIELRRLLKEVSHMDITLLAGEKGINHFVSWVHMVETKEATTFLEGGEIAFSTGIGLNEGLSLYELVKNAHNNKAAGIVINTGPFIEIIPNDVVDFGNQNNFPIFLVPWKVHIAEIMRIFCYAITKSDQKELETAAAFKNAIFFSKQEELYVVPLSQLGFHVNWSYYVCAIKVVAGSGYSPSISQLESICTNLNNYLLHRQYDNIAIFHYENQILIVLGDYKETDLDSFVEDLQKYSKIYLSKTEEYFVGIGKRTDSIRCLYKSYNQAVAIQKLHENHQLDPSLISYSRMGIYKLLMGIEDKEVLTEYYKNTILLLHEYDQKSGSDLTNVLRCYLAHDGSVNDTADELYLHRNTVNYKLNKAGEILNMNLSSLDVRLQLKLGFMIKDML